MLSAMLNMGRKEEAPRREPPKPVVVNPEPAVQMNSEEYKLAQELAEKQAKAMQEEMDRRRPEEEAAQKKAMEDAAKAAAELAKRRREANSAQASNSFSTGGQEFTRGKWVCDNAFGMSNPPPKGATSLSLVRPVAGLIGGLGGADRSRSPIRVKVLSPLTPGDVWSPGKGAAAASSGKGEWAADSGKGAWGADYSGVDWSGKGAWGPDAGKGAWGGAEAAWYGDPWGKGGYGGGAAAAWDGYSGKGVDPASAAAWGGKGAEWYGAAAAYPAGAAAGYGAAAAYPPAAAVAYPPGAAVAYPPAAAAGPWGAGW